MPRRLQTAKNAMCAGAGLIVLSFLWSLVFGSGWSDERAKQFGHSATELHRLANEAGQIGHTEQKLAQDAAAPPNPKLSAAQLKAKHDQQETQQKELATLRAKLKAQQDQLQETYQQQRATLESSRSGGWGFSSLLYWLGVISLLYGAVGFLLIKKRSS